MLWAWAAAVAVSVAMRLPASASIRRREVKWVVDVMSDSLCVKGEVAARTRQQPGQYV
jgi:hypothetical protein